MSTPQAPSPSSTDRPRTAAGSTGDSHPIQGSDPHRQAPTLSRSSFLLLIVVLLVTPVGLIAAVWYTLPPIRETPLPAEVRFEDFVQVAEFQAQPEKEQRILMERIRNDEFLPAIVITNSGEENWNNLGVELNGNFDFISGDPLPAGDQRRLFLHRFITRQGDDFRPLEYPIREVKVFARLPNGERAIFEADVDPYGRVLPHEKDDADASNE